MADIDVDINPTGGLEDQPANPEMVHGGFRANRHQAVYEQLADERGMGREQLRGNYEADAAATENVSDIMGAVTPGGKRENIKVSPWSK